MPRELEITITELQILKGGEVDISYKLEDFSGDSYRLGNEGSSLPLAAENRPSDEACFAVQP